MALAANTPPLSLSPSPSPRSNPPSHYLPTDSDPFRDLNTTVIPTLRQTQFDDIIRSAPPELPNELKRFHIRAAVQKRYAETRAAASRCLGKVCCSRSAQLPEFTFRLNRVMNNPSQADLFEFIAFMGADFWAAGPKALSLQERKRRKGKKRCARTASGLGASIDDTATPSPRPSPPERRLSSKRKWEEDTEGDADPCHGLVRPDLGRGSRRRSLRLAAAKESTDLRGRRSKNR